MTITEPSELHEDIDAAAIEEFAGRLVETLTGGLLTALIDIGGRTGLFEAVAEGPATSAELAARRGLQERYVREWLAAMASAGIVEYDANNGHYWLPREHGAVLTGDTYDNLVPLAGLISVVTRQAEPVARCFAEGGGVPYRAYLPELHDVMDALWKPLYRDLLVQEILPLAPGLVDRLESGIRVADVACGSGNSLLELGAALPAVVVRGLRPGRERDRDGPVTRGCSGPGQRLVRGHRRR